MEHKTNYLKKLLFLLIILVLSCTFYVLPVSAQQVSLSISPPLLNVTIKPDKSILIAYTLQNTGDPVILRTKVLPFVPNGINGNISIVPEFQGPIRFELDNSTIKMGDPFFLKSKDRTQALLRIRVPQGAPEGDYYYIFLAETQAPPTEEGVAASRATATIGSPILITVTESGQIDINAKIALFDVSEGFTFHLFGKTVRIVESSGIIPIHLIVQNNGQNKLQPNGTITLTGNFGERANYDILPQNILAQSQRLLTATPQAALEERQKPSTLLLKGFFIGNYKLDANLNFGEGTPNIKAQTGFLAVPLKFILGLSIALILGFFIVRRMKERDEEEK